MFTAALGNNRWLLGCSGECSNSQPQSWTETHFYFQPKSRKHAHGINPGSGMCSAFVNDSVGKSLTFVFYNFMHLPEQWLSKTLSSNQNNKLDLNRGKGWSKIQRFMNTKWNVFYFSIRYKLHPVLQSFKKKTDESSSSDLKVCGVNKVSETKIGNRSDGDLLLMHIQWLNECERRKQTDFCRLIICISGKWRLAELRIIVSAKKHQH